MGFCGTIAYLIVVYMLISVIGSIWLTRKTYEFRVQEIKDIGNSWSGSYFKLRTFPAGIRKQLGFEHDKVLSENEFSPLSISTGGLRGSIHLLYASLSEFLAIYYVPLTTSGDTGRHLTNMTITVLQGNVRVWSDRTGKVRNHDATAQYSHFIGERSFVEIEEDTYLLVYGRGLLPLTMGYWISDSLFGTMDPTSAVLTVGYYWRATYSTIEFWKFLSSAYDTLWNLAYDGINYIPKLLTNVKEYVLSFLPSTNTHLMADPK